MKIYHNDTLILDIEVDDNSYRYRAVKGEHTLTLYYALAEHFELPVGAYCIFENETYTLEKPQNLKMVHSRDFEYTAIFDAPQAKASKWKFRNPIDRRLKFNLTAKPIEHLQMFVDNMNMRDSGWTVGDCIDAPEKVISYNHAYCIDALSLQAETFGTEYEFEGKRVSLRKVEHNRDNPLPLSYGMGNGFKPNCGRSNYEDGQAVEELFIQGGTKNINQSKYGNSELLLPKNQTIRFDGIHFEDEAGFDESAARTYITDSEGLSIRRADRVTSTGSEDSLDCSEIYPKRVGTVSSVIVADAANNFYDFVDDSIPAALNYNDYLIDGDTMTVIFQSGMLAGDEKQFEVKYIHADRRFEIIPQEIDGMTMPGGSFIPRGGDTYAVFGCMLPDAYVCDNATKSGASWEMFRTGVKYLYEHEEQRFSFTGELDGIWAKKDWVNIGGRIKLGGYVRFTNESFQPEPVLVRIIGIKDYINNPHSPELELSNSPVSGGASTTLKQLESNEVLMESLHKEAIQFTKRRYRDAKETIAMLEDALLENFTESISPISVQTMSMLLGDESLQFQFVNNTTNPKPVPHNVVYDTANKQLSCPEGIIQHLTLGIDSLSSSHEASEYHFWAMEAFTSAILTDSSKKYYLYAKVSKSGQTGVFVMSSEAIAMEAVGGFYHLLMGVLNSEFEGVRSYVPLYGYTEILPGRMTVDKIVSSSGTSFFDMLNEAMKLGDVLDFNSRGDRKLRLKGTMIQSEGGEAESPLGCYRGVYNENHRYYTGDKVSFTYGGITSTYQRIGDNPTEGISPLEGAYWRVDAQGVKGDKGDTGDKGDPGDRGEPGIAGADGQTSYFHIKYAPVENPTAEQMSETPSEYIGTYVDFTEFDSDNPADYTWSRFEGAKGEQGIPGINGADGRTSYLHIKYSDDGGKTFTSKKGLRKSAFGSLRLLGNGGVRFANDSHGEVAGKYIGTYVDFEPTDSTDVFRYKWAKIAGEDGIGIGKVEEFYLLSANNTGVTAETVGWSTDIQNPTAEKKYLWNYEKITYSDGSTSSTTPAVIVTYVKDGKGVKSIEEFYQVSTDNTEAPTNWLTEIPELTATNKYLWNYEKITYTEGDPDVSKPAVIGVYGDKGDKGIPGEKGLDGSTSYLHIAYANSADGSVDFSVSDSTGKLYMGQYTDFTEADSTDHTKYKWTKIKGEQGVQGLQGEKGEDGIPGKDGEDGRTSYFHIKYSPVNNPTAAQMTETPSAFIGTYVDFTEADSTDPSKYTWSRFEGLQGEQGIAGTNGEDGKTSYLHIKYSNDGGQTFASQKGLRKSAFGSLRLLGNGNLRISTSNVGEVEGDYIGTYVDDQPQDSSDVFRYKWVKVKGEQGAAGDYYEYRYAKNGSTSTPPELDKDVLSPTGWTTIVPDVGELEYLWMIIAKISGDGTTLLQSWSTPTRFTPKDGKDGEQGSSPALVFRGPYDASATYYGNKYRVDAVKYGDTYYVARTDAGTFSGIVPTNGAKWNSFGATFDSVATNLLLAENANIAGWIFRNGRLEAQSGKVYLDGNNGKVRLDGTIQLSTGYTGNFSDVNLFYLPAVTSIKYISMGYGEEDIGKVCRLYNSSPYSGAAYYVKVCAFGIKTTDGVRYTDATIGGDAMNYYVLVPPQTTVELTCFEMPKTYNGTTYDVVGRWDVTSRFSYEQFTQSTAKGRFPRALALGTLNAGSSPSLSGKFYDGRNLSSVFTVERRSTGEYKISWSSGVIPTGYFVMCTGNNSSNIKGVVGNKNSTYFQIFTSNNSGMTDGNQDFMILDPNWWYNMQ